MREIKVIDNFLSKKSFKKIEDIILSDQFPWYWVQQSTWEKTKHGKDSFLCHSIQYKEAINSSFCEDIMQPIQSKLKYSELLRAKLNLQYNRGTAIKTNYHSDFPEYVDQHKFFSTAILYLTTCNGYTQFECNKAKIRSVANRLVLFPGELCHRGVCQTDTNRRVLLNINFI